MDCREIDEACVSVHGTVMQELAAADRNEKVKRLDKVMVVVLQSGVTRSH